MHIDAAAITEPSGMLIKLFLGFAVLWRPLLQFPVVLIKKEREKRLIVLVLNIGVRTSCYTKVV